MNLNILSNLIIKNVIFATTVFTEENTKSKRENRLYWAVILKYEGETIYTVNGRKIVSNKNNLIILPKGCSYEWQCVKKGSFTAIEFESDLAFSDIFTFNIKNCDKILHLMKFTEQIMTTKPDMYNMKAINNTYSVILSLIENCTTHYVNNDKKFKIQPAIDFISKNYNKEIKNDELAKICNISTVYFRKLFKNITGTSPIAYTHNIRIEKAKEMLKSDYGSITDIATSLGFNNIYEFSKAFKKHTGFSPSKY